MIFFVLINGQTSNHSAYTLNEVNEKLALLVYMKTTGKLKCAYVIIGGGSVYVVEADSFAEVRNAFRESDVLVDQECEIHQVDESVQFDLPD